MLPHTQDPIMAAAYALGFMLSLPALWVLWKLAVFFAKAILKLDKIDEIERTVKNIQHRRANETFSVEMSLSVIEQDINRLQEKTGLSVREFPDRRVGPSDRRATG